MIFAHVQKLIPAKGHHGENDAWSIRNGVDVLLGDKSDSNSEAEISPECTSIYTYRYIYIYVYLYTVYITDILIYKIYTIAHSTCLYLSRV